MTEAELLPCPAIWLRREGDYAVVLVETRNGWAEIIRELADGAFSHIKEASTEQRERKER